MRHHTRFATPAFVALTLALCGAELALAAVTPGGDTTFVPGGTSYVGKDATGTLNIDGGSSTGGSGCYIGYNPASNGIVTLSGAGTEWYLSGQLHVGYSGSGTLSVNGGLVSSTAGYIGYRTGASGAVTVSGAGAKWANGEQLYVGYNSSGTLTVAGGGLVTTKQFYASQADLFGNGTITVNGGAMLDGNLIFGAAHGGTAVSTFGTGGTLNVTPVAGNPLCVGYRGAGSLRIAEGVVINSSEGFLGYNSGSTGLGTVSGLGSQWNVAGDLYVGQSGSGTLTVADAGQVTAKTLYASTGDLLGNGTITANHGAVLDANLVFDALHGTTQTLPFGAGGALNLTVTGSSVLGVGHKSVGSMRIAEGVTVASTNGSLGRGLGSTGAATVTGAGSNWAVRSYLFVGQQGSGALAVEAGGQVSSYVGHLGYEAGSTGTVQVSGAGSVWNNQLELRIGYKGSGKLTVTDGGLVTTAQLFASPSDLLGNGTITVNGGAVLDANLVFDASHGTTQSLAFGSGGALNLTFNTGGPLGVGLRGASNLRIAEGVAVDSVVGFLGYDAGSTGTAVVSGPGSKWNITSDLYFGYAGGSGELIIEAGGQVNNYMGIFSLTTGSRGVVTVRGAGSQWNNRYSIYMAKGSSLTIEAGGRVSNDVSAFINSCPVTVSGPGAQLASKWEISMGGDASGRAALTVADGGKITAKLLHIGSQSTLRLHVSGNDMVVLGDSWDIGRVNNNSTIALYANPLLPPGIYTPITEYAARAMTWSGAGTCTALGGTWDNTAKTFTVAPTTLLAPGDSDDVTSGERFLFTDLTTGQRAGAGFGTVNPGTNFSASPAGAADLAALLALLAPDQQILDAWNFTTNFSGGQVLLSFDIGAGHAQKDLSVWRLQGGLWSPYAPATLSYGADGLAGFTVDAFSGYAIVVPEPSTLALLMLGTLLLRRRRQ